MMLAMTASLCLAQEATVTLTGDIIDNMCAGGKSPEALAAFVPAHTKDCAIAPQCAASGYSIFSDGKLIKLDAGNSAKISEFLQSAESTLHVEIVATQKDGVLNIISIKNI